MNESDAEPLHHLVNRNVM